jgi:hypothetical protein
MTYNYGAGAIPHHSITYSYEARVINRIPRYTQQLFLAYSADFYIDPRPACCETEEGGERETDSCKIVEVPCPGAHSLRRST